jgi:hypothetical protein
MAPLQWQCAEIALYLRARRYRAATLKKIADDKWIFSRGEALLLAATDTTSGMPGGMERLDHSNEYKRLFRKVKKQLSVVSCQFSVLSLCREQLSPSKAAFL